MKVAVIGANGQLGTDLFVELARAGHEPCPLNHGRIEIASLDSVRDVMRAEKPDLVVNTAAVHNVDRCELDPEAAFRVNALGPRNLAVHSRESGTPLVHVSTDYVFNGKKKAPYEEHDTPAPLNVYGSTKLAGEQFVRALTDKHFVVRTSGLFGKNECRDKGPNFVERMLDLAKKRDELRVVDDEILTPTSTLELSRQIVALIGSDCYGVIHATAQGYCSWYSFTTEIFRLADINTPVAIARPDEFPVKVPRPSYSVLENKRLRDAGLDVLRPWDEGLAEYLGVPA